MTTYALLDSGSTISFCSEGLLDTLGIRGTPSPLSLTTLEAEGTSSTCRVAQLEIVSEENGGAFLIDKVHSRPKLPISLKYRGTEKDARDWPHLRDVPLKPHTDDDLVELLLGVDAPDALRPLHTVAGQPGEPFATRTELGWTLTGPLGRAPDDARNYLASEGGESVVGPGGADPVVGSERLPNTEDLTELLKKFWELEEGDVHTSAKGASVQDKAVEELWRKEARKEDGHYTLPIPFKDPHPKFPDDLPMALDRLASLRRKLSKDPALLSQYKDGIQSLLDDGYAERVPDDELCRTDGRVWYLPHHGVVNPSKEKIRIVFDCAARYRQISLNSQVMQGPDLTNNLLGVLTRFRTHPVAFMADIEAMFHQVRVPKDDRDVLRFLWYPGGRLDAAPLHYRMKAHLFGGTWSPSVCAFALKLAAKEEAAGASPAVTETILRNFYVDDCLKSAEDPQEVKQLAGELKQRLAQGGFRLTKWTSNSVDVLDGITPEERSKGARESASLPLEEKALGVYWDVESDCFTFKTLPMDKQLTRRGLLSMMSSVYDPLGFACPFILKAKQIVQELARLKLAWDEPITDPTLVNAWQGWVQNLREMERIKVPRCLGPKDVTTKVSGRKRQLHHFADASEVAYGVVTYLRTCYEDGTAHTTLVAAKSRLAPLKTLTIPRLELQAATLAARQDEAIRRELDLELEPSLFWTDSTTVLRYINNEQRRFQTFVANRVTEIRGISEARQWRHVPSEENPADDASRGALPSELDLTRWLEGPSFLRLTQEKWPPTPSLRPLQPGEPEVRSAPTSLATLADAQDPIERLLGYHSDWTKLRKAVARILLCRDALLGRDNPRRELRPRDLDRAERAVVRAVQRAAFPKELEALEKNRPLPASSYLRRHTPRLQDGVMVSTGRLKHSRLPATTVCPYLLPSDHPVAAVIARDYHERAGHAGRDFTLAETRQRYWLLQGRGMIERLIAKCLTCRRRAAKPSVQLMADLPEDRVLAGGPAYEDVGVDYFGPFYVKRGRGREKRYGCIFTCLTSRAVHLEMAYDLTAGGFINCLVKFMARRGKPRTIRADNGTNFVGAERELREAIEAMDREVITRELLDRGIDWAFNPPHASHMGGVWERQIRSVRRVILGLVRQEVMTDETFTTLLAAAEGIINNRPLVAATDDPASLEALTPNNLLMIKDAQSPPGDFDRPDPRQRWKHVQFLVNVFWERWLREYLPTLRTRSKWTTEERNVTAGDLVLVIDYTAPRDEWRLGRVVQAHPGPDGLVRSARIYTGTREVTRPVSRLCVLEEAAAADEKGEV